MKNLKLFEDVRPFEEEWEEEDLKYTKLNRILINKFKDLFGKYPDVNDNINNGDILKSYVIANYGEDGGDFFPIIYLKAYNRYQARLYAAILLRNREIYTTGFYGARFVSDEYIQTEIDRLQSKIDRLTKIKNVEDLK